MRIFALLALGLAACATTPTDTTRYEGNPYARGGLAGQQLDPGECGLFVWRNDPAKTFALFSSDAKAALHIGKEVAFVPGEDALAPSQAMTVDGRAYALALDSPVPVEGGTRYDKGTLQTQSDAGWDVIIPVLGLSLCQPMMSPAQ